MSDRLDRLETARDRLAKLLETADEAKAPALVREYRAVLAEIEKLDTTKAGSKLDELAARRASRTPEPAPADEAAVQE